MSKALSYTIGYSLQLSYEQTTPLTFPVWSLNLNCYLLIKGHLYATNGECTLILSCYPRHHVRIQGLYNVSQPELKLHSSYLQIDNGLNPHYEKMLLNNAIYQH